MDKGYVYVLTNPSFKEDWVKIGRSRRIPDVRSKELFNTAVPLPYEIYATLKTEKYIIAEKMIHRSIDRLTDLRINKNREFFNIPPEKVYDILNDIKELLGDEGEVELYGDNVVESVTRGSMGERFDFFKRGIKEGEVVTFIDDPSIKAIVANNRQVFFEGELYYLSALTRLIYERMGRCNNSGAYQGPAFFIYNKKKLTDIDTIY